MLSLVTISPVITAFHSCRLSHHVFDQVNLWPDWVGFETAIFWQCSPGTVETQRLYPWCDRQQLWKAVNKKLILRLRSLISKWFQLKSVILFGIPWPLFKSIISMGENSQHSFEARILKQYRSFYPKCQWSHTAQFVFVLWTKTLSVLQLSLLLLWLNMYVVPSIRFQPFFCKGI